MFVNRVKFTNFCQHLDKEVEFRRGLNVIVGPNGSGKSNIVNGIYGALTGDFTRNAGKSADNISINKIAGRASQIELSFSHGNKEMSIVRRLDPVERQFCVDGNTYTADKDVAERLEHILEVDKDILGSYVFVEQWDNFGPLSLSPAKRIAAFQKLFRIDQLNKISDELSDGSVKLAAVSVVGCNIQELSEEANGIESKINGIEEELASLPSVDDLDGVISSNNNKINNWKLKAKLENQISSRQSVISDLLVSEANQLEIKSKLNSSLLEASDMLTAMKDEYDTASNVESLWIKYDYYLATKSSLETKLKSLEEDKLKNLEPTKPEGYTEDSRSEQEKLDGYKFKLEQNKRFVSSLSGDKAECPVCGTSASNLVEKLEKANSEMSDLSEKVLKLTQQISDNRRYDNDLRAYLVWFDNYKKSVEEIASAFRSLNVETKPDFSREEATQIINNYKNVTKALATLGDSINSVSNKISSIQSNILVNRDELDKELKELEEFSGLNQEEVDKAAENVANAKGLKTKVTDLTTSLAVTKSELKACRDKVSNAEKQNQLAVLHSSWNDRVESLKKIFKYNALPMVVSYKYMDRVVVELNKTLSAIGVPFNIELEPDLSFTANFGSHKVPAARLSGGQKVILTIAYRLAVNFTFATNLGLLCLDEPTVGLDDANLSSLERAFERLREFSMSNGVQIIVVTHEKGISHLFDHTIDLAKV